MHDTELIKNAREFAEKLVLTAGKMLIESKGKGKVLSYKDLQDIQTDVDLKIEKMIIDQIEITFPTHSIFSEEVGVIDKESEYSWVIDPLDGTKEFMRDIPLYCSAVMLEKNGVPIATAIYDPELKELYSAGLGMGAYLNSIKLSVSKQNDLTKAMLFTYLPKTSAEVVSLSPLFDSVYRIRGHANHNLSYCWVAKGGYDGHFSLFTPTHWWDVAPGILVLREAGGRVTNLAGEDITHQNYTNQVVGTNGLIHDQFLKVSNKILNT